MREINFRCSSIGKLMTEPNSKAGGPLSVGAQTYIRTLAAQEIFSIDFEIGGKPIQKGLIREPDGIALVNRVRGLNLAKNTERRTAQGITGECDLFDPATREGRDLKCSWSAATFPITSADCEDKLYEWQMRGYMLLWDAPRWHVDYVLLDTPDDLIGFEPMQMHLVSHIPEHMRLTSWTVTRDAEKEAAMLAKLPHARAYYARVIDEFDRTHRAGNPLPVTPAATPSPTPKAAPVALPESIF